MTRRRRLPPVICDGCSTSINFKTGDCGCRLADYDWAALNKRVRLAR